MVGAEITWRRIDAKVELVDAQGWSLLNDTPRFRAEIDYVELKALDIYTLIVDKIDLASNTSTSDSVSMKLIKGGSGVVGGAAIAERAVADIIQRDFEL